MMTRWRPPAAVFLGAIADNDPQALPAFRDYLKDLIWPSTEGGIERSHLSEFHSDGFNGDLQAPTAVIQPVLDHPVWHQAATSGGDILALESSGMLDGGDGNDIIFGSESGLSETGADLISGGEGHDILVGLSGDDTLMGEAGNDVLRGGAGHDILVGGSGQDVFDGGDGNDLIFGFAADDLTGEGANSPEDADDADYLYGGEPLSARN